MTPVAPHDPEWAARVKAAGVPLELFDSLGDDSEYFALQRAILHAAHDALLSDEDVHPLLVRNWSGYWPAVNWPPNAPALTRRCAAILASQQKCEVDRTIDLPTDDSMKAVRDVIIAELALTPTNLLAVLADHWPQLRDLKIPDEGSCSLLSFAEDVLLTPLISACVQIWIVVDQPPPHTPPAPAPGRRTRGRHGPARSATANGCPRSATNSRARDMPSITYPTTSKSPTSSSELSSFQEAVRRVQTSRGYHLWIPTVGQ